MTMHVFVSNEDERALGLSVSLRLFNLRILQRRAIVLRESAVVNTGTLFSLRASPLIHVHMKLYASFPENVYTHHLPYAVEVEHSRATLC
jgi:hypothetical protein